MKFILIVGASGSGKSSIADKLAEKYNLKVLQSYTTRPKRYPNEIGHTFVNKEEFDKLQNKMAYFQGYEAEYCSTYEQVEENDIYVIDPKAAKELKRKYHGEKDIKIVYIKSSVDFRYTNMNRRGDKYRSIVQRIIADCKPFAKFEKIADFTICNNKKKQIENMADEIYNYLTSN